ncbi:hypothetical protein [Streptomyces sp. NRRL F-2890]|uniref:hypothetical protein n=1 Tax=Streptomyces sp. NRRL F-2890 TaxID=1463845 RepID=UPI000694939E|nr:hypothetical protein [Streptomyces sp. NRRL F-2890]
MIAPITIDGMAGLRPEADHQALEAALDRFRAQHPHRPIGEEESRLVQLNNALRRYNILRPRLMEESIARDERDTALAEVEARWEALSTAANWLAAHHTYVLAVAAARIAIGMWEDRAAAAQWPDQFRMSEQDLLGYRQILAAGHPPVEPLDIKPAVIAERLMADLEQAYGHRRQLAAETLGLAVPGYSRA